MNERNILDLLGNRERYGIRNYATVPFSTIKTSRRVKTNDLSIVAAWNPNRLNNMVLAVGPGTPASILLGPEAASPNNRHANNRQRQNAASSYASSSSSDNGDGSRFSSDEEQMVSIMGGADTGAGVGAGANSSARDRSRERDRTNNNDDDDDNDTNENETETETRGRKRATSNVNDSADDRSHDSERKSQEDGEDGRGRGGDGDEDEVKVRVSINVGVDLDVDNSGESESDEDEDEEEDYDGRFRNLPHHHDDDDEEEEEEYSSDSASFSSLDHLRHSAHCSTSIRHGGCINTATWMDCPWRLSLAHTSDDVSATNFLNHLVLSSSHSSNSEEGMFGGVDSFSYSNHPHSHSHRVARAVESFECPTQIMTSGDDRLVKIWNCSAAMGTIPPIPAGDVTRCPFAYYSKPTSTATSTSAATKPTSSYLIKEWKERYKGDTNQMYGIVELLATVYTGHRGNVFHATPLQTKPGKILTCAADGYLILSDIEVQSSGGGSSLSSPRQTIMGPPSTNHERYPSRRMCFSHHMVDDNTGLLCGERGLRRFDLRLPSQSQPSDSLLGDEMCKSCIVFSASGIDSAYVFAGGLSDVGLYDLRFITDHSESKVIQTYRPSSFNEDIEISVSGIDLTKDRKELLVSYESDQIYTFPVFPSCTTDPTVDEMTSLSKTHVEPNNHFASYGGHVNRYTFLKSAKYAGPNDEYICTGSDSGHAFIYNKQNTSVVSLLKADKKTCNGIVPHPTLPIFITYGIGTSAKLWRATIPVDDDADDTIRGRRKAYHTREYTKSNIVSKWNEIKIKFAKMRATSSVANRDDEEQDDSNYDNEHRLLPDEYAVRYIPHEFQGVTQSFLPRLFRGDPFIPGSENISNDLLNLPDVLTNNYYEATLARRNHDDPLVRCPLNEFHRRLSVVRLYFQADQLGLALDAKCPWMMSPIPTQKGDTDTDTAAKSEDGMDELSELFLVDTIPDSPADYLPYDALFSKKPVKGGTAMNEKDYKDFYLLRYRSTHTKMRDIHTSYDATNISNGGSSTPWELLHAKTKRLKEEGNKCLQNGSVQLAAYYYDKALKYCAVAFMDYPQKPMKFVKGQQKLLYKNGLRSVEWTDLLKTLISTRLNLSMAMLKEELSDLDGSCTQATLALKELEPFCEREGVVMTGWKLEKAREGELAETFLQAKELQAKAFFRLASANFKAGKYKLAKRNFENCLSAKKEIHPDAKPDKIVVRRIEEARRLLKKKKKRTRKKCKLALDINNGDDEHIGDSE